MEGPNAQPNEVETMKKSPQEAAQQEVAELYGPISSAPFSEVGVDKVLNNLSIEAASERNRR